MTVMKGRNGKKQIPKFHFPLKLALIVNRRDWLPTKDSVLCELHFEEKYLRQGKKCTLQWSMNPVPTIYLQKLLSKTSSLPTRKLYFNTSTFQQHDMIRTFKDLNEPLVPAGFQFKELDNCVLYFHLVFGDDTNFPKILESIKVDDDDDDDDDDDEDDDLHVQLQCSDMPLL